MKRVFVAVILLFLVFSASAVIVSAQDELTLESLQDLISGLDERLSAIEEKFADPWSPDIVTNDDVCQSPLHAPLTGLFSFPRMIETIHQETADAYRAQYGVSVDPEDADLASISFSVDSSEIYLEYVLSQRNVVETWANCEFLGHSDWTG